MPSSASITLIMPSTDPGATERLMRAEAAAGDLEVASALTVVGPGRGVLDSSGRSVEEVGDERVGRDMGAAERRDAFLGFCKGQGGGRRRG